MCMLGISSAERAIPSMISLQGFPHSDVTGIPPLNEGLLHSMRDSPSHEGILVSQSPSHCSLCHHGASLTEALSLGADVLSRSPP